MKFGYLFNTLYIVDMVTDVNKTYLTVN